MRQPLPHALLAIDLVIRKDRFIAPVEPGSPQGPIYRVRPHDGHDHVNEQFNPGMPQKNDQFNPDTSQNNRRARLIVATAN
jgi:hypothetical protein